MKEQGMKISIALMVLLLGIAGCQKQPSLETTVIKANTMICGSCVKNVQKAVSRVDGVKEVNVDLKGKTVEVKYLAGATSLPVIEAAIADAGYDANDHKRSPEAYEKLDACCKSDK
jgi:mercuric ion binding protein